MNYMKPILRLLLFSGIIALASCKTASKLYQKGRYDEAVALAAKKLGKKPNDAATLDILQNAYRFAVDDHEAQIRNYTNSSSDLRFENIYAQYLDLQRMYEAIHSSPSVFDIVQPTDYSSYITTYKEEAGNARVDRGDQLMGQNSKQGARDAYYEFQKALALKPGDLTIQQKLDDAYANAVTNVVLLPLTRNGFQYSSYNYDFNNFSYNVLRYLSTSSQSPFTKYYGANEAGVRMDNTVDMRFSDVNIGRYRDQRSTREVSKQIVGKEIVHSKDSVTKEYITVKAKITITTRVLQADGLLQATARDYDNRFLWSDTYRGDYSWQISFATYTGDERALSDDDRRLLNQREQFPPSNDEIIRIIMNEIQTKVQCGIADYFNRTN
jgi:predicted negative regulator of RcsB-dependent stress response